MAQQHYDGKKHKKNAARADLLEQLGKTLDMGEMKGMEARLKSQITFHRVTGSPSPMTVTVTFKSFPLHAFVLLFIYLTILNRLMELILYLSEPRSLSAQDSCRVPLLTVVRLKYN